jgi:hypothetical protein
MTEWDLWVRQYNSTVITFQLPKKQIQFMWVSFRSIELVELKSVWLRVTKAHEMGGEQKDEKCTQIFIRSPKEVKALWEILA